jgi:hypothetical protein
MFEIKGKNNNVFYTLEMSFIYFYKGHYKRHTNVLYTAQLSSVMEYNYLTICKVSL